MNNKQKAFLRKPLSFQLQTDLLLLIKILSTSLHVNNMSKISLPEQPYSYRQNRPTNYCSRRFGLTAARIFE